MFVPPPLRKGLVPSRHGNGEDRESLGGDECAVASLMLLSTLSANNQTFNAEGQVQPATATPIPTHASLPRGRGALAVLCRPDSGTIRYAS